mmetsp:Transcript_83517/g.190503  ORF Transcript_83517/g.190503 Transcript_83517/m.190503 type:complete len:88 (-) Transcript_83517:631-894(-)
MPRTANGQSELPSEGKSFSIRQYNDKGSQSQRALLQQGLSCQDAGGTKVNDFTVTNLCVSSRMLCGFRVAALRKSSTPCPSGPQGHT